MDELTKMIEPVARQTCLLSGLNPDDMIAMPMSNSETRQGGGSMKAVMFVLVVAVLFHVLGCAPKYDWGGLAKGVEKVRER